MNFIINKIAYILERPWLIVFLLVVIQGVQISNLKKEVQNLKNEINPTVTQEVRLPTTVMPPKQNLIPELSQEVHIPNMPTNTLPTEEK